MQPKSKTRIRFQATLALMIFLLLFWAPFFGGLLHNEIAKEYEEWFEAVITAWRALIEGELQ